nr:hypothetical protein [Paraburkholderia xenovorans]
MTAMKSNKVLADCARIEIIGAPRRPPTQPVHFVVLADLQLFNLLQKLIKQMRAGDATTHRCPDNGQCFTISFNSTGACRQCWRFTNTVA